MRYAKSFLAAFSVAFAFAVVADNFKSAPVQDAGSSITYPDGVQVRVKRPGYPDVV